MKKELPMTLSPLTTFGSIANFTGLLWNKKEQTMPWFCDHYIQMVIEDRTRTLKLADFLGVRDMSPFIDQLISDRHMVKTAYSSFVDFARVNIDADYYLSLNLDLYYFSISNDYMESHRPHVTFIAGYDDEKRVLTVYDFYDNSKYQRKMLPYDEANESFKNFMMEPHRPYQQYINHYKLIDGKYEFNIALLKQGVKDYINSEDSLCQVKYHHIYKNNIYGLACYDHLASDNSALQNSYDIRAFHLVYEMKVMMQQRIEYLLKMDYLIDANELRDKNTKLINQSLLLRNLCLKNNHKRSISIKKRIKDNCDKLKMMDEDFMCDFYEKLI